mgnify:CR=1 FL=1
MNFIIFFALITLANVIIQTVKSLFTIKGGKLSAATVNAIAFGFYTYIIFFTADDSISLWQKALITAICNFIGVFFVKFIEERLQKDRLWIFNCTAKVESADVIKITELLKSMDISLTYNQLKDDLYTLSIYSYTQSESEMIKSVLKNYKIKYCVIETKSTGKR